MKKMFIVLIMVAVVIGIKFHSLRTRETQSPSPGEVASAPVGSTVTPAMPQRRSGLSRVPQESVENYYKDLPPLSERIAEFAALSDEEIGHRIGAVDSNLDQTRWIERANSNELSVEERRQLAAILQEQSALNLVKLKRQLSAIEEVL